MRGEPGRMPHPPKRTWRAALACAAIILPLAACSEVSGLLAGGSAAPHHVQQAAIDVLLQEKVAIKVAPECSQDQSGQISCTPGKTEQGQPITVAVSASKPVTAEVKVADRVVYSGSVQDAIDKAGRVDK